VPGAVEARARRLLVKEDEFNGGRNHDGVLEKFAASFQKDAW